MRLLSALFLLLFFSSILSAQASNPQPAYYITTANDTIRAIINRDNDLTLSKGISVFTDGKEKKIAANSIKAIGFNDPPANFRPVSFLAKQEDGIGKDTVTRLARVLIDNDLAELRQLRVGGIDYSGRYTNTPPYVYYLRLNGTQYFLEQEEVSEAQGFFQLKDHYKGVLNYAMRDWPAARNRIERLRFVERDLISLVNNYLEFISPDFVADKTIVRSARFFPKLTLGGGSGLRFGNDLRANGRGLGVAAEMIFHDPKISNSIFLGGGLEYYRFFDLEGERAANGRLNLSGHVMSGRFSTRLYFTRKPGIQPFVQGGMRFTITSGFTVVRTIDILPNPFRFVYGGGLRYKAFSLAYRRGGLIVNGIELSYSLGG